MIPPLASIPIDYHGRFLYLEALQEHWPEVLISLTKVLPTWRQGQLEPSNLPVPTTFQELQSRAGETRRSEAIQGWAKSARVADEWLLDAAAQTLAAWSAGKTEGRWYYLASESLLPEFQCRLHGAWLPPEQDWMQFKRAMTQQLAEYLKNYRRTVAPLWGEDKRSLWVQAFWTVWWQQGKSPQQIRQKSQRYGHLNITLANIQLRVHGFARAIGLTLRESKTKRSQKI